MANIMDLLGDGMKTVRKNNNISLLYILYQVRCCHHTDLRSEIDLSYNKSIKNSPPNANKAVHSGFESQRRRLRSSKQGYQWPHKNDLCPPKKFKKRILNLKKRILYFRVDMMFHKICLIFWCFSGIFIWRLSNRTWDNISDDSECCGDSSGYVCLYYETRKLVCKA